MTQNIPSEGAEVKKSTIWPDILFICIVSACAMAVISYMGYQKGEFGNFYLEQDVFKGNPSTWLWHNGHTCWWHITERKDFTDSTFIKDAEEAKLVAAKIKYMESKILQP